METRLVQQLDCTHLFVPIDVSQRPRQQTRNAVLDDGGGECDTPDRAS